MQEMASRHRVRAPCLQIIKTATVPAAMTKRVNVKQFHDSNIKFPPDPPHGKVSLDKPPVLPLHSLVGGMVIVTPCREQVTPDEEGFEMARPKQ